MNRLPVLTWCLTFQTGLCRNFVKNHDFWATIKPHYRSEGPRQGSCGVFWALYDTICEVTVCELT